MKKVIFSLTALAIAAMFSFCAKEEAAPVTSVDNTPVTERNPCSVTVTSDGPVTICGLRQNDIPCTSCCGSDETGFTAVNGTVNFTGYGQRQFFIKNTGFSAVMVTISTPGGSLQYGIKPGQCANGTLFDTCILSYFTTYC